MRRSLVLAICTFPLIASIALSQTASPTIANSANGQASSSETDINSPEVRSFREGFKSVSEGSNILLTWGLAIIAGSIITIVSTSYLRPHDKRIRLIYLLFIPGWVCTAISIYFGSHISRRYIAGMLVRKPEILDAIESKMLGDYGSQLFFLQMGLLFFSGWLALFLFWWIFGKLPANVEKPEVGG